MTARAVPFAVGGRYEIHREFARGGMATVHHGRIVADGGVPRVVAIKRLRPELAGDRELVTTLADEARTAGRVRHANVVAMLDVVEDDGELFLVMEFVLGESLARLLRTTSDRHVAVPPAIAARLVSDVALGLQAAHDATDEQGRPLHLVHRDVSPQNIIVGKDGLARVVDLGIARAAERAQPTTRDQGKLPYMAPETVRGDADRRSDVYSLAVVLAELSTGRRLLVGSADHAVDEVPEPLASVVRRGLSARPDDRHPTAEAFASAVRAACRPAPHDDVARWLEELAPDTLRDSQAVLAELEMSGRLVRAPLPTEVDLTPPSMDDVTTAVARQVPFPLPDADDSTDSTDASGHAPIPPTLVVPVHPPVKTPLPTPAEPAPPPRLAPSRRPRRPRWLVALGLSAAALAVMLTSALVAARVVASEAPGTATPDAGPSANAPPQTR